MIDNGTTLVIVDGTYGYTHTLDSSGYNGYTDTDFLGADQVTFQDGYFIFNKPGLRSILHIRAKLYII